MKQLGLYIFIALVVGIFVSKCTSNPSSTIIKTDTVTVVDTQIDTLFIDREVIKVVEIESPTLVEQVNDSVNVFADSVQIDTFYWGYYTAKVKGQLLNIDLGFIDNRPEKVIFETNTITNKITNTIRDNGLYVGVVFNNQIGPAVHYNHNKWIFSTGYTDGLHLGVSYKIW